MKVKVNRDLCVGAGHCEARCPDIFKVIDGKSQVLVDLVPKGLRACVPAFGTP